MKYPGLIIVLLCTISFHTAFAQSPSTESDKTYKAICIKLTKELVPDFQLNENEYIKLKSLNMAYLLKVARTNLLIPNSASGLVTPFYELEAQHEYELLSFLNPHQLEAYRKYKENNKSVLQQLTDLAYGSTHSKELLANTATR